MSAANAYFVVKTDAYPASVGAPEPPLDESPLALMGDKLMAHLAELGGELSAANRARIVGVSTPTYLKRVKEQEDR